MNHAEAENMLLKWAKEGDRLHTLGRNLSKAAVETLKDSELFRAHDSGPSPALQDAFRAFGEPLYLDIRISVLGFEIYDHGEHVWRATTFVGAVEGAAPKISERLEAYAKRVAQLQAVLDAIRRV